MRLSQKLSERVFEITKEDELLDWLRDVDKELSGISWVPLGGIENNVHTVEVASDPALALVERPTNSIDALLDLKARLLGETAPTPHEAARRWWKVPLGGISEMKEDARREIADLARVTMIESGAIDRPTVLIQDSGTGQHPDDFANTHLSLLRSNKKSATHMMGVFNAGGAASYKFAKGTFVVSRLAPTLLDGRPDEIGVSFVRYNPLDPERFKSGVYEYMVAKDKSIIRLDVTKLPDLEYGSYVKLVEYQMPKYARGAHEPKHSLWHLFHAALPDLALPFRIIETRVGRFPAMKGKVERRVVTGLLHLLNRKETAEYSDIREIDFGSPIGRITLRYFVLNEGADPEAYVTSEQALMITLNGQRQVTKDRAWLKRNLGLYYIFKRLIVLVDGTGLTSAAKRQVFSSTRESGVDSPLTKTILDRVTRELLDDEDLAELNEQARQRTLEAATRTTTAKVKKALASQIAAYMKGDLPGAKGGSAKKRKTHKKRKPTGKIPSYDDSMMLDVPDSLKILTDPLEIETGDTAALRLEINAKNDFLPAYADFLSVVFGPELKDHLRIVSKGRLLGGRVRITVEASADTPILSSTMKVALVIQELGVLLTAEGKVVVVKPEEEEDEDRQKGGEPNIDIVWIGRDKWDQFDPPWDEEATGACNIYRDLSNKSVITKVEWFLNEAFGPYEKVLGEKKLTESALKTFRENYEYPVALALFKQRLAEDAKEDEADEEGKHVEIPDDYVKGEKARMARAVLMAMEPDIKVAEAVEV